MSENSSKIKRSDFEQGIANCRLALELDGTIPPTEVSQSALVEKASAVDDPAKSSDASE